MIKIAYLIEAHTDIEQLIRLSDALIQSGDVYIHVDKKTNEFRFWNMLDDYVSKCDNVFVISNRVNVAWGGFSQVKATCNLMTEALKSAKKYTRFVLLSGLDYPVWSPSKILSFFEQHQDTEYVCGYNISTCPFQYQLRKIKYYHFFRDIPLAHKSLLRRIIVGGSATLLKYIGIRRKPFWNVRGQRENVYFGSTWIAITRDCADYVLNEINTNRKVKSYFSTVYAPDELCVPTLVMNSLFSANAIHVNELSFQAITPLHYLNYEDCIWSYDEKDFETIIKSGKMFFRKAISGKSEGLIEMIKNTWDDNNNCE